MAGAPTPFPTLPLPVSYVITILKSFLPPSLPPPPRRVSCVAHQFVAEEVRLLLAELGFKSLDEAIGRADVLSPRTDVPLAKTNGMLDLDFVTNLPDVSEDRFASLFFLFVWGGGRVVLLLVTRRRRGGFFRIFFDTCVAYEALSAAPPLLANV